MQDREKKLLIGLGIVLVSAFALPMFESWFLLPVTEANNQLSSAQDRLEKLIESETQLKQARRNLADWKYESLPPNPFTAQREYQEWLMDLARMSGFSSPEPTLGTVPTRGRTFVEIPVTIEAKATLEQLARFLYHFERVALLHRVQMLDVQSPASVGDPLLDVTLLARGLSLTDAPPRSRLFPTTTLREDVSVDDTTLPISPVQGFPTVDGFQIKIDEELMTVRERTDDTLVVERGAEGTTPAQHGADSLVELFPVDRAAFEHRRSFDDYFALLEQSPFTKPSPPVEYDPELTPLTAQTVTRGEAWSHKLTVTGWDPSGGGAVFDLDGDVPAGLTIDPSTGELSWNPGPDVPAGQHNVLVVARSEILSGQQVEATLPITLREPNLPPTIGDVPALTAYSGRPMTISLDASDPDGDDDSLTYSLTGEVPSGARIDEKGEIHWIPPLTLELGEYELNVAVSDSGDPQKSVTKPVSVTLKDDSALFTRLVGIFQNGGEPEAMLNNLTSGETTRVKEGAAVNAADIQGRILDIARNHIVLQVDEQAYRLDIGMNLRQMTPLSTSTDAGSTDDASSG